MIVFLFRASTPPANSLQVLPGLYLSFDAELLNDLIRAKGPKPDLRIFAGYAGWGPDQLENEIARGDWHPIPADADLVFRSDTEKLWLDLIRRASARSVRNEVPFRTAVPPVAALRTVEASAGGD
jgi:putative transcriptional regulator